MGIRDLGKLVLAVAVCLLAGYAGSIFTTSSVSTWYPTLNKPAFTPPSSVFAPVWTALYLMMGVAAYLVWRRGLANETVKGALLIFVMQLALNVLWSLLFFGLQSPSLGLLAILALWMAILLTGLWFARIAPAAALLLVPYFLWVTFASVLNFSIWQMNA
jgi:tryptophan-rich sensory protein